MDEIEEGRDFDLFTVGKRAGDGELCELIGRRQHWRPLRTRPKSMCGEPIATQGRPAASATRRAPCNSIQVPTPPAHRQESAFRLRCVTNRPMRRTTPSRCGHDGLSKARARRPPARYRWHARWQAVVSFDAPITRTMSPKTAGGRGKSIHSFQDGGDEKCQRKGHAKDSESVPDGIGPRWVRCRL